MYNKFKIHASRGFTLLEMVITVSIMGILAAVVTPTYLNIQMEAKRVTSESNISQLKQGLINLYLEGLFADESDVWPSEPTDNQMTHSWANSTVLYNGRTVNELYSGSQIIYNPDGNPFLYYLLPATETEEAGFLIEDPDLGTSQSFRP